MQKLSKYILYVCSIIFIISFVWFIASIFISIQTGKSIFFDTHNETFKYNATIILNEKWRLYSAKHARSCRYTCITIPCDQKRNIACHKYRIIADIDYYGIFCTSNDGLLEYVYYNDYLTNFGRYSGNPYKPIRTEFISNDCDARTQCDRVINIISVWDIDRRLWRAPNQICNDYNKVIWQNITYVPILGNQLIIHMEFRHIMTYAMLLMSLCSFICLGIIYFIKLRISM